MSANLENSAVATRLQKVSFHSNPKERQCPKFSNYCTIALISHASKVMLKILQARLQQYVTHELSDVHSGFRKGIGTRDQIANIPWIIKKAGDLGSIPGLGRTPGEGNGNPLQYSCLENPMDSGAWWAIVHGVTKSRTRLSDYT